MARRNRKARRVKAAPKPKAQPKRSIISRLKFWYVPAPLRCPGSRHNEKDGQPKPLRSHRADRARWGVDLARFCTSESSRPVLPYTVLSPNTGFRDDQARSAARRRRLGGYRPRQARRPVPPAGLLLPAEGAAHCGTDHAGVLVLQ